jgi:hypothetical protein
VEDADDLQTLLLRLPVRSQVVPRVDDVEAGRGGAVPGGKPPHGPATGGVTGDQPTALGRERPQAVRRHLDGELPVEDQLRILSAR